MAMGSALALELRRGTMREEEGGRLGETASPAGTRPALRKRLPEDRGAVNAAAAHSVDEMTRKARSGDSRALILFPKLLLLSPELYDPTEQKTRKILMSLALCGQVCRPRYSHGNVGRKWWKLLLCSDAHFHCVPTVCLLPASQGEGGQWCRKKELTQGRGRRKEQQQQRRRRKRKQQRMRRDIQEIRGPSKGSRKIPNVNAASWVAVAPEGGFCSEIPALASNRGK